MTIIGWAEIALILALTFVLAVPLGRYMAAVVQGDRTLLSPVLGPVEQGFYRLSGVDAGRGMDWKQYAFALVALQAVHFLLLYLMLRFQQYLPLNPMAQGPMSPRLAFNTAISFVTNTNWQAYGGETALSYGTQMWGLTVHNFLSAATGIAAAVMVARAFVAGGVRQLGNFWVDMTRIVLYILLPIAIVYGLFLLWQGVPDTLAASAIATTLEGGKQTIALGPVAFQEAIKMVGTNGGGFFNANSAHPFENPTALSNVFETISEIVIPFGLAITFGVIVKDRRQGRALFWVMAALLIPLAAGIYAAEGAGNPLLTPIGVSAAQGNMEGKEVRFGTAMSSLFAATTTGTSDGAVIAMHDSFTPLGGGIPIFLMELGEVAPGGVGSGLYAMIVFALLAVFVAGLMVGRTPEYLGKKVQAREIKLAMLAVLILPLCMLVGAAWSLNTATGTGSLANSGPHGLSEMLYAWTSATANNGSAFAGLSANTPLLDYGLGAAMLLGRFAYLVPVLAIAGSLAIKPKVPDNAGTFPTHGPLFIGLMLGVVLILGGLQFLPALSLGPLAEHFAMLAGKTY